MRANRYSMKTREIPLDDSWDVIVAGGGPSGCAAAAAAARDGAKTLLIEATGALGGMGTSGLVPAWCPFTDKEQVIYRGLALRVFEASREGVAHIAPDKFDWIPIDPERLKRVYDDLVTGSGASVLFHTALTGVDMAEAANGDVSTILVANKAGLSALRAKVYVDATGDGDLAAWAGAEFEKGKPGTGDMQPATHCFILANVDYYAYRNGPPWVKGGTDDIITRIVSSGKYPQIPDRHACNNTIGPGCVGFNAGHLWNVDNTDPASVSKALVDGRKQAAAWHAALAEFHPKAFGGAYLAATGALMGIRETRRIVGDYVLTIDDFLARRSFEDEICRNSYFIDVHHAACNAEANRKGETEALVNPHHYSKGESHGIPYRCLTPRGLRNVLVAGRCISSDRPVQGSVRVMPVCLCTGESAGVAAAMAATSKVRDVHAVDVARLRARLREVGAYLP